MDLFHSEPEFMVQESRGENDSATTHHYFSDSLAKVVFPVSTTLCSAGLDTFIQMFALGDTGRILLTGHSMLFMTLTLKISVSVYRHTIYLSIYLKSPLVSASLAERIALFAPYIQYI